MKVKVSNMAECKDCIHYSRCNEIYEAAGFFLDYEKSCCKQFSNRSEWVHLPCNVGDTVYHFSECFGTICPYFVENIYISYWGDNSQNALYAFEADYHYEDVLIDCIDFELEDIGKTVFLTREEAEKALEDMRKEDENNDN